MKKVLLAVFGTLIVVGGVLLVASSQKKPVQENTQVNETKQEPKSEAPQASSTEVSQPVAASGYESYDAEKLQRAESGKVVLFFYANWCPTCRELDRNLSGNLAKLPQGFTILKTDYDSYSDLKRKYGVTYQHTLVQVDASGNLLKKWSNSLTIEDIISQAI